MLNILDILLSIFRNFFEGGGAQNSSLPPGARYPRYATVTGQMRENHAICVRVGNPVNAVIG